jgi:hypothetical protein
MLVCGNLTEHLLLYSCLFRGRCLAACLRFTIRSERRTPEHNTLCDSLTDDIHLSYINLDNLMCSCMRYGECSHFISHGYSLECSSGSFHYQYHNVIVIPVYCIIVLPSLSVPIKWNQRHSSIWLTKLHNNYIKHTCYIYTYMKRLALLVMLNFYIVWC